MANPLMDPKSGSYLKTACLVLELHDQPSAEEACIAYGMKLFQIDSTAVQTALFGWLEPLLSQYLVSARVDGKREADQAWYYYSYGRAPAFSGLDWLVDSDTFDGYDTMVATNQAFPAMKVIPTFKVDAVLEAEELTVLCEFKSQ